MPLGHDDLHRGTGLDQGAAQLGGFVTGNAPREAQHKVFSSKVFHARQCSSAEPLAKTSEDEHLFGFP